MTIKPCVRCGATDRHKSGRCKPCNNARSAKYRQAHPEYDAKYRQAKPEKVKAANDIWRKANLGKRRAYNTIWRKANPKYRDANLERARAYNAKYSKSHPEKRRIKEHNRRARKRNNGGRLSPNLAETLFKRQRGLCVCCKQPLGEDYHLDHIMPLSRGGKNEDFNIQLLTARCNLQKNAKHPIEFMQSRGLLL